MAESGEREVFIQGRDLYFGYHPKGDVIKGIDIQLYSQELTAVMGPNGSGKTTLGKLLAGILQPRQGSVQIGSLNGRTASLGQIGGALGYLFQEPDRQLFAPSVREEVEFPFMFGPSSRGDSPKRALELLKIFKIEHLADSPPFRLSRGEKQRLLLAAILINNPRFAILDEPTTGLDPQRRQELGELLTQLKQDGLGMAVITHDLNFAQRYADRIIRLEKGSIVDDYQTI